MFDGGVGSVSLGPRTTRKPIDRHTERASKDSDGTGKSLLPTDAAINWDLSWYAST